MSHLQLSPTQDHGKLSALRQRAAAWCHETLYERRSEWIGTGIALTWLLGGLLLLRILPEMAYRAMPADVYWQPVMALAALTELPVLGALGIALVLAFRFRAVSWQAVELGRLPHLLILSAGVPLTWAMTTYHPNYFVEQLHATDRVLTVLFLIGSLAHPCFLPLLVTQLYLIMGQFAVPLIDANIDRQLAFELLTLAVVPSFLKLGNIRIRPQDLLLAILVVIGAFYLKPGLGKMMLNWFTWNQPAYLFPNAVYQNGWLTWLSDDLRAGIYRFLSANAAPMKLVTLATELGVLFLALHRRCAISLLLACMALHLGIFISCGVCFWKWVVIDITVAAYLWRMDEQTYPQFFCVPRAALAAGAMLALMPIYKAPANLAWYDTPMTSRYSIDFVGVSGQEYQVPPYRLAPFDLSFAQGRLFLADERPKLADCMGGVSDLQLCRELERTTSAAELQDLLDRYGDLQLDPKKSQQLKQLLQRYISAGPSHSLVLGVIPRAPQHIWSDRVNDQPIFDWQEPIATIRLRRADGLIIDDLCQQVQESTVFAIPGPGMPAAQIASQPDLSPTTVAR